MGSNVRAGSSPAFCTDRWKVSKKLLAFLFLENSLSLLKRDRKEQNGKSQELALTFHFQNDLKILTLFSFAPLLLIIDRKDPRFRSHANNDEFFGGFLQTGKMPILQLLAEASSTQTFSLKVGGLIFLAYIKYHDVVFSYLEFIFSN